MRIRSAQTLVFTREAGEIIAFNYLTNSAFACSHDLLVFLSYLDAWRSLDEIARFVPLMSREEMTDSIDALLSVNAVTAECSPLAEAEDEFHRGWRWGIPAALFHFSVQDKKYVSQDKVEAIQIARMAEETPPPLYLTNDWANGSSLKLPAALGSNELLGLMARRRTIRSAAPAAITLAQLSDCLFAGLGITGETRNCVGTLPLSMTPSGGARNPYEAYVYARAVEGLDRGFYHYAAIDHTLARLESCDEPEPAALLGGQGWANDMPCIVILCAQLERTMWKYDDANAYRVVLIEAGHIGQNLMLAATYHGLTACPSAALNHSLIRKCINSKNRISEAPIYALTLARPNADDQVTNQF